MRRNLLLILFLVIGMGRMVFGQSAGEEPIRLSLGVVLRIAAERSPQAAAASERVKQAAARLGGAVAHYLPQVSLSASEYRQTRNLKANGIDLPFQTDPVTGPFNSFDARMTVTQEIFNWETIERIRSVSAAKSISISESEKTKQDVMALAGVLFLDAVRADARWETQKVSLDAVSQNFDVVETKWKVGSSTKLEYEQAQSALAAAKFQLGGARMEADEKKLDLLAVLGIPFDQKVEFETEETLPTLSLPDETEVQQSLLKTPEIQSAEAKVKMAVSEKRAAFAEYLPTVSGMLDYGLSGSQPSDSEKTYTMGAKVSLPVFEGGKRVFGISENRSAERESKIDLRHLKQEKNADALIAVENIRQMQRLIDFKQAEFRVAQSELEMAAKRLESGDSSRQAWVNANANEKKAEDDLNEAHAAYITAQIQMLHELGRLREWIEPVRSEDEE